MRKILQDKVPCPRCNANSQIRIEERYSKLLIYHICSMCRYRKYIGSTNKKAIYLYEQQLKYMNLLSKTDSAAKRKKILAKIELIKKSKDLAMLGIGVKDA